MQGVTTVGGLAPVWLPDPATMAPVARLAEIAQLLAAAFRRARVAPTSRHVGPIAPPGDDAAPDTNKDSPPGSQIRLALLPESEPSCAQAGNAPRTSVRARRGEPR